MSFDGAILDVSAGPSLYKPWGLSPSRELVLDRENGRVLTTVGLDPVALPGAPRGPGAGRVLAAAVAERRGGSPAARGPRERIGQPAPNGQHWRVRLDGSVIEPFTAPAELELRNIVREFWLVDGVLYGEVFTPDPDGTCGGAVDRLIRVTDGQVVETPGRGLLGTLGLTGGRLIAQTGTCESGELTAFDPTTGVMSTLIPAVPAPTPGWAPSSRATTGGEHPPGRAMTRYCSKLSCCGSVRCTATGR